jgi:HlyD family secretion protein
MKKAVIGVVLLAVVGAGVYVYRSRSAATPPIQPRPPAAARRRSQRRQRAAGRGAAVAPGRRRRRLRRRPVRTASPHRRTRKASRATIQSEITVVGNLIGKATVSVAPRAAGRVESVTVQLGDRVSRGQRLAKIEDFDIQEQVKQAEAAQQVSEATIRQREADLKLAQTNAERSRSLFERQLLPKQTLDDNEARYQSAVASVDLARAQSSQSKARSTNCASISATPIISSPVTGFVSKRSVDPGAFVSQNVPVVDVVDISTCAGRQRRREGSQGAADRQHDARGSGRLPGEVFTGRIARVSPVLDPATRTAPIEIEIPNAAARLKPGMYARVSVTTSTKKQALVVPATRWSISAGGAASSRRSTSRRCSAPRPRHRAGTSVEVLGGLNDGDTVITTGSSALRDGDRIVLPGGAGGAGAARRRRTLGRRRRGGRSGARHAGRRRARRRGAAREGAAAAVGGANGRAVAEGGAREGGARPGGSRDGGSRDGGPRRPEPAWRAADARAAS